MSDAPSERWFGGPGLPSPPTTWPDQGGDVVILNGGVSQDRITIAGDNPIVFPDFSVGPPPVIEFGGWSGPPPGPPAGTGLVGPNEPPAPPQYTAPPIEQDELEGAYLARCEADVMGQGADNLTATQICQEAWLAANPAAAPASRRRRRTEARE